LAKKVVLTFDDGAKSLWHTAYPLLKKYDMKAIAFVIPGRISHGPKDSTMWPVTRAQRELFSDKNTSAQMCNWEELSEMENSGHVDIQSHSFYHALVFVSNRVIDFVNLSHFNQFDSSRTNFLVRTEGREALLTRDSLGAPIYGHLPLYDTHKRYIDDEGLRQQCIEFARRRGTQFFRTSDWRRKMFDFVESRCHSLEITAGHFENDLGTLIGEDIGLSKSTIERELGKRVEHLCFPFGVCNSISAELAGMKGFRIVYGVDSHTDYGALRQAPVHVVLRHNGDRGEVGKLLQGRGHRWLNITGAAFRLRSRLRAELSSKLHGAGDVSLDTSRH
jgi:hypothetical protein